MKCLLYLLIIPLFSAGLSAQSRFPLKPGSDNRYLVDATGKPFLIHGDTPWSLFTHTTPDEARLYLETRRQQGFNTILVNVLDDTHRQLIDGTRPFPEGNDFARPNEAYFRYCDQVLGMARDNGFLVMLCPVYLACCAYTDGWKEPLAENGVVKARQFGAFLARRWKNFDNVIWCQGGDRHPWVGTQRFPNGFRDLVEAVAEGIRSEAPHHLHTAHTAHNATAREQYPNSQWLTIDNIYTYYPEENKDVHVYEMAHRAWADRYVMPTFLIESAYENDERKGATPQTIRRQVYWAILGGMCGHLYGNRPMWGMNEGWQQALHSVSSREMQLAKTFFDAYPWWQLLPETTHRLLVYGYGTYGTGDYASAAVTADHRLALVYVPTQRTITLDLSQLPAQVAARWFDPTNGRYQPAVFSKQKDNDVFKNVSTPGKNAGGFEDWLLVVEGR